MVDDKTVAARPFTLRVVHVIDGLGPGGAEHNLVNLLLAGARAGFEHHVVGLYSDDTLAGRLRSAGISVTMLGGRGPRSALGLVPPLVSLIRRVNPQLVHTQLVMSDLVGRIAVACSASRPMLSTLQNRPYHPDAIATEIPSPTLGRILRRADRWLGTWTRTRYLAVSESVRASYVRELGIAPERIEVLYNSVDFSEYRSEALSASERRVRREKLGLAKAPLLLNVARHTRQKGLLDLVSAMDSAHIRASGARLLLVGGGPDTGLIQERIRALRLEAAVSLLGRRSDVRELMAVSDLFVLPSIYEGLPLALLEALAMGLPVVASDLPEIREVTGERGAQLVAPSRPELLAEAIARQLANPDAGRESAREARSELLGRFDLRQNAERFGSILKRASE